MESRKKLDPVLLAGTLKSLRQEICDPLLFKRQMLLDPVRVFFILFLSDRTGTVNKRSTRFYILSHHRKDLPLQLCEIFDLISRHPLFDIRFLSDNSETGTWEICQNHICLLHHRRIQNCRVPNVRANVPEAAAHDVLLNKIRLSPAHISRFHHTGTF